MRLSDLLREDVFDAAGERVGRVRDVRIVQDGPNHGYGGDKLFRVHGLIVGRGAVGERLGYGRAGMRGPWLFMKIFGLRQEWFVPWEQIGSRDGGRIDLLLTKDRLEMPAAIDPADVRP
jgi:hypothetical protein